MDTARLVCDSCGTLRQAQPGIPVNVLRDQIARVGWISDPANDRDLCPIHAHESEAWRS